jgi:predicted GNAT superfamily acetyltransferase
MIDYRVLHTVEEIKQVEQIEMTVWGLNALDAVPMYVMHAAALNGGLVLGAFDDDRMIGMAYAFTAKRGDEVFLWSHMTGVLPEYQSTGVGYELKQYQRRWALNNGYNIIRWTYDPLIRGNAHFNIARLGTTANIYHENFYGDMDDDINRGLPSDRVEAEWYLPEPKGRAQPEISLTQPSPVPTLIHLDEKGLAHLQPTNWELSTYFIPLPPSLASLKKDQRLSWRMAVRSALQTAFARGFVVNGFIKDACGYVVERLPSE